MHGQIMLEVLKDAILLLHKPLIKLLHNLLKYCSLSLLNTIGQLNSEVQEIIHQLHLQIKVYLHILQ
jgi:hypothetical protein